MRTDRGLDMSAIQLQARIILHGANEIGIVLPEHVDMPGIVKANDLPHYSPTVTNTPPGRSGSPN